MSKKKLSRDGIVYSTDPSFPIENEQGGSSETLPPEQQKLRVRLDAKHRAGKAVTLVEGFIGTASDLEDLGKKLKNFCGTGGSTKNGEAIIQGDQRDKVCQWLLKNGFKSVRRI